jgi:hypothetical protein
MATYYLAGGRDKPHGLSMREWHRYEKGIVARLDADSGELSIVVEHRSPAEVCPDEEPSFLFKAGTLAGDRLWVCSQTEVLVYTVPEFQQVGYVSLPCFNDLHHVLPTDRDTALVVSTGLDMVFEVSLAGERLREWNTLHDEEPWGRFSPEEDYRKWNTTKPHEVHPNFVFEIDGEVWVTRLLQRDALCLSDRGKRIAVEVERPHDGVVFDGRVYFTTIDGHVVVADAASREVRRVIDLTEIAHRDKLLGWCRGIAVLDPDHVLVGFSRLRRTRYRENLSWIKRRLTPGLAADSLPTRVALYDLARGRLEWEHDVEPCGLHTVFSIHCAPD